VKTQLRFGSRIHTRFGEQFDALVHRARFLEENGFDIVLLDDHLLYGTASAIALDPFSAGAAIAYGTKKIKVGVAVTDLIRRHPAILAQSSGTVSAIANGRFILGLGSGDMMNQTPFGLPTDHRFGRFREGVMLLKMLWSSSIDSPVSFKGRFHDLTNAYLQTGLTKEVWPPLYFAAFGERMLKFTGEEADGWIPHCHTPETFGKDLAKIRDSSKQAGRSSGQEVIPSYYTVASIANTREKADADVMGPAKFFLALIPEALRKIDPSIQHPGRIWEKNPDPRAQREMIRKIASTIPRETALSTVMHGTPSDCIEQISSYAKEGCREFLLTFTPSSGLWSGDEVLPMARLFAEKVIRYFQEEYDQG
jgi:phthiodiolone/phenolphthiodiolone dimycocerosates ketoreductase